MENDLEEWRSQLGTLLGDQTQTFLQAINGLNVKLMARLAALEDGFASFRPQDCPSHSNDRMAEGASTGRALPSTVKNKVCRFHPGCRHGVACRFLHIDGEAEGSCSDTDEEASEAYENARCVGCGYHPSMGCASICPTLAVHGAGGGGSEENVVRNDSESNKGVVSDLSESAFVHSCAIGAPSSGGSLNSNVNFAKCMSDNFQH